MCAINKNHLFVNSIKFSSCCNAFPESIMSSAIFTPSQALMAAKAGADFVAPYVNRIDNVCGDGVGVVAEIVNQFAKTNKNYETVNKNLNVLYVT